MNHRSDAASRLLAATEGGSLPTGWGDFLGPDELPFFIPQFDLDGITSAAVPSIVGIPLDRFASQRGRHFSGPQLSAKLRDLGARRVYLIGTGTDAQLDALYARRDALATAALSAGLAAVFGLAFSEYPDRIPLSRRVNRRRSLDTSRSFAELGLPVVPAAGLASREEAAQIASWFREHGQEYAFLDLQSLEGRIAEQAFASSFPVLVSDAQLRGVVLNGVKRPDKLQAIRETAWAVRSDFRIHLTSRAPYDLAWSHHEFAVSAGRFRQVASDADPQEIFRYHLDYYNRLLSSDHVPNYVARGVREAA